MRLVRGRTAVRLSDADAGLVRCTVVGGALNRCREFAGDGARNLKQRFIRPDANRADLVPGDMTAPTQQGQHPPRIGILPSSDVHAEPYNIIKTDPVA